MGYGADVEATDSMKNTPMHFVLAKKNMKELSKWTVHLNQVTSMYCIIFMKSHLEKTTHLLSCSRSLFLETMHRERNLNVLIINFGGNLVYYFQGF